MNIQKQVAFEKHEAQQCNCDYEDLKRRLDRFETLSGHRYPPTSPRADSWIAWSAAWDARQAEIDELKAKLGAVENLQVDCMINQIWFMKGTPVANLVQHAAEVYKAEAVAQNSKIEFGTDDNENWFAHDVPFFGQVQISRIEEHGLVEWDIYFSECWQGPFDSKSQCIKHLEECIQERREEAAQGEGHE